MESKISNIDIHTYPPKGQQVHISSTPSYSKTTTTSPQHERIQEAQTQPRLVIEKLVVENFKSYGGKHEIGPFHCGFNSIVGANGSGKSNVIDAMLFVFGKRASKIRLKRLREQIHTSNTLKCDSCSVSVHFIQINDITNPQGTNDNTQIVRVPNSAFIVTRTVDKNDKSVYYIDNRVSSFTEVSKVLREKQIDLDHNRFLILQGEIEQIAMMKPKGTTSDDTGILEFLEDITGSKKYNEHIKIALEQHERYAEQRNQQQIKKVTIEKECDLLREERDKAMNLQKKECKYYTKLCHVNQLRGYHVTKRHDRIQDEQSEIDTKLLNYENCIQEQIKSKENQEKEINNKNEEKKNKLNILEKCKMDFNECEKEDEETRAYIKSRISTLKGLEEQIITKDEEYKKYIKQIYEEEKLRKKLEDELPNIQDDMNILINKLKEIEKEVYNNTSTIRIELEESQRIQLPIQKEISKYELQIQDLENTKTQYLKEIEDNIIDNTIKILQDKYDKLLSENDILKNKQKQIEQSIDDDNDSITKINLRLNIQRNKKKNEYLERHNEQQKRMTYLEDKLQNMNNQKGTVIELLLQEKKKNIEFTGVYGILGTLATIDEKYDIAISTSCSALRYILVDTTKTAERCIEYLRKNNLGRHTFLVLEKQEHLINIMYSSCNILPPGSKRLFDLIIPRDKKYLPAFYAVLQDTLVANDIETANRYAFQYQQRWRVVTLNGQLIDTSGTISGGGTKAVRGYMDLSHTSSSSSTNVDSIIDYNKLKDEYDECRKRFYDIEQTLQRINNEINENEQIINTKMIEIDDLKKMLDRYNKEYIEYTNELNTIKNNLNKEKDIYNKKCDENKILQERINEQDITINKYINKKDEIYTNNINIIENNKLLKNKIENMNSLESIELQKNQDNKKQEYNNHKKRLARIEITLNNRDIKDKEYNDIQNKQKDDIKQITNDKNILLDNLSKLEIKAEEILNEQEINNNLLNSIQKILDTYDIKQNNYNNDIHEYQKNITKQRQNKDESIIQCKQQQKEKILWDTKYQTSQNSVQQSYQIQLNTLQPIHIRDIIEKVQNAEKSDWDAQQEILKKEFYENLQKRIDSGELDESELAKNVYVPQPYEDTGYATMINNIIVDCNDDNNNTNSINNDNINTTENDNDSNINNIKRLKISYNDTITLDTDIVLSDYEYKPQNDDECKIYNVNELQEYIDEFELESKDIVVNMLSIQQYIDKVKELYTRNAQLDAIDHLKERMKNTYETLRQKRLIHFMEGFTIISNKLKEIYQMLTLGGDAELDIKDGNDPFQEGIIFTVRPPKKSWKEIVNLSGGEKTLSSLALIFALHQYKPTPFYIIDEIDAALDFKNVSIVAHFIKSKKNIQFIVISLRNNMFELSDRLVGIYKSHNITNCITIDPYTFNENIMDTNDTTKNSDTQPESMLVS